MLGAEGRADGGVASECTIWGGVASALQQGSHGVADTKCDVIDPRTGLSCSTLSEVNNAEVQLALIPFTLISFLVRSISDWNSVPQSVVSQPSLNSFKMALTKSN